MANPQKSLTLKLGFVAVLLGLSGLLTYLILQVPQLRSLYEVLNLSNDYLSSAVYHVEIVLIIVGTSLGILVNILLVLGIKKNRRWFLAHWIVYHSMIIIILFMTSILIFITQKDLFKLIGLASLALAFFTIFFTSKVYNVFVEMKRIDGKFPLPGPPGPPGPLPHPYVINQDMKHFQSSQFETNGFEFYPIDPISRGVSKRMELHSYLPKRKDHDSDVSLVSI